MNLRCWNLKEFHEFLENIQNYKITKSKKINENDKVRMNENKTNKYV